MVRFSGQGRRLAAGVVFEKCHPYYGRRQLPRHPMKISDVEALEHRGPRMLGKRMTTGRAERRDGRNAGRDTAAVRPRLRRLLSRKSLVVFGGYTCSTGDCGKLVENGLFWQAKSLFC